MGVSFMIVIITFDQNSGKNIRYLIVENNQMVKTPDEVYDYMYAVRFKQAVPLNNSTTK